MDRMLRRGSIGLSMAWLNASAACPDKEAHDQLKEDLSSREGFDTRVAARREFMALRADEQYAEVIQCESDLRGGDSTEPVALRCLPGPITKFLKAST